MIAQNTISPLLQHKLSFPFKGNFQEFLYTICTSLNWTPVDLAERSTLDRSTWANYITPKEDKVTTPRHPESLRRLYDALEIEKYTGKTWNWFYLFGSLTLTYDPLDPEYVTSKESASIHTLTELTQKKQSVTLTLAEMRQQLTQAQNFLRALHTHIDALSDQLQIPESSNQDTAS